MRKRKRESRCDSETACTEIYNLCVHGASEIEDGGEEGRRAGRMVGKRREGQGRMVEKSR